MKLKWLPYLFITLLVISCKKPEESEFWTEVHVTATNFNTGEPLTDVYIGIVERKQKQLLDSETTVLSEGYTDSNGEFHFGWKAKRNSKYSYEYIAQANHAKYKQIEFLQVDYLTKGNIHEYDIKLVEYGSLNMNFQNVNCFDEFDKLRYRYYLKKSPQDISYIYIYSPYWDNELFLEGCLNLTGDGGYQPLPAGTYTLEWNVTRGNGYTSGSDEIIVPDGDSVTYVLQY